ncbi:MAG TPA: hypothetical protein VIK80_13280 [Flavihumibacter sp.]|jgi:hypothetical protein
MKKSWFLFLFLILGTTLQSQVKIYGTNVVFATDREGRGILTNAKEIRGNPFACTNWYKGEVVFSNGLRSPIDQLNFDLYSNKPAFREGESMMHFKDPVKEISFVEEENGQTVKWVFRNEYPATGSQSRSFYYLLLEDGQNFHLLQLVEKFVKEEMVSIGSYEKHFEESRDWYLFDVAANKLVRIPKNKKEFNNIAGGLSPALAAYLSNNKQLNTRSEQDLRKMVIALNQ